MNVQVHVREKPDRVNLQLYYVEPLTGVDVTKSAGTADRHEAERAAARWEEELRKQGQSADLSWEQFRIRYEDEQLSGKASGTLRTAATAFNNFEKAIGKPRHLDGVDASVISRAAAEWRHWGMAEATIHGYLSYLRSALYWAFRMGFLIRRPYFTMPKMSKRHMKGRPIKTAEARRMLRSTRQLYPTTWRCWVRFQRCLWLSGLRLAEAVRLSWDAGPVQVDLDSGRFPMLRFKAEGHKGRRDQLTPITPDFAAWLRRTPPEKKIGPVVPLVSNTTKGRIQCLKRIGAALSAIGRAAGVVVNDDGKHASAHDFRRSFGTRWALHVKPITLMSIMRHKSIETTMSYYVGLEADDIADELWRAAGDAGSGDAAGGTRGGPRR